MKRDVEKTKGLIRGAPTAVVVSIAIHLLLFFVLGGIVVVKIVKEKAAAFKPPPPIDRPKMELIKPHVKMKKTIKPGATQRIVSKRTQGMPEMQLPVVEGMGEGLGGGIGGFELMPDISEMSMFGGTKSAEVGNDFEGTFYSVAYDRRGEKTSMDSARLLTLVRQFIDSGWNPYIFAPYYRASQKLYTTQIFLPSMSSEFGPSFFGIPSGPDFDPYLWCVHYKGKIANQKGGRFRFRGFGDDILLVRVNGKLVFNGSHGHHREYLSDWESDSDDDWKYYIGAGECAVGNWFELEPGTSVAMEVLIGEIPGGDFCAYLLVEKEGEDYPKNRQGMPVLPVFKTAEIPEGVKDKIKYELIVGEGDLDSDLMFNVY